MHDIVLDKSWFFVCCNFRSFKTTTRINANINDNRSFFHMFNHSFCNNNRTSIFATHCAYGNITTPCNHTAGSAGCLRDGRTYGACEHYRKRSNSAISLNEAISARKEGER